MTSMLMRVREISDVFVDACVRNEAGDVMFLSCYGRDGAIQQFFAAFSLGTQDGGFDRFTLVEPPPTSENGEARERVVGIVGVGDANRLTKLSGRLPKDNLFGNLAHAWVYDPVVLTPDRSNRMAWLIDDEPFSEASRPRLLAEIWSLYKLLSPVPLLDDWCEVVLRATHQACVKLMHSSDYPPIGRVAGIRVSLPDDFGDQVSRMVKAGMIGLAGEEATLLAQLAA